VALLFSDEGGEARADEAALAEVMPELADRAPAPRSLAAAPGPTAGTGRPGDDAIGAQGLKGALRTQELEHIQRVVAGCGGNLSEAARRLGVGRTTLYRKLGGAAPR
jgi:propionate catabolism operon transcriptional regulator